MGNFKTKLNKRDTRIIFKEVTKNVPGNYRMKNRMKNFENIIFIFIFLFISLPCFATPLEGPIMPKAKKWVIGYQYNIVNEQKIDYLKGNAVSDNNFLNLSYAVTDYLCLDFKLGIGDLTYNRDLNQDLFYNHGFAGGYGLRLKLYPEDKKGLKYIIGMHHICVHPHSKSDNNGVKQEVIWDDWQVDNMFFYEFGKFIPYIGFKAKKVYLIRKVNEDRLRMKTDIQIGFAIGFDYKFKENVFMNTEVRFVDEQAYTIGVSWLF